MTNFQRCTLSSWPAIKLLKNQETNKAMKERVYLLDIKVDVRTDRSEMQGLRRPEVVPQRRLRMDTIALHEPSERV
jgi:hypothetical protein